MNAKYFIPLMAILSCSGKETIKPEMKPLTEAVYASGYVMARSEYEVLAQAEGYVLEKVVDDGDVVKAGDPLYILESGQQSARFDLARKSYAIAAQNYGGSSPVLQEALAQQRSVYTKLEFDSVNFVRYKNLIDRQATTRAEFDRIRLTYENSRNDFELQQSRLRKIKDQLYLELQNAKSQLAVAGNESGKYTLRSDADGMVFKTTKDKGELVRRGESLAVVGDANTYYLQLSIDELDINRIKKGQEILVTIDAYSSKAFHAKVDKIYPMVNLQQQSVRVDAVLMDTLPGFFSGLAVEANIIVQRKDHALVIPKAALTGKNKIRIVKGGEEQDVQIAIGVQTLEEVEVLSGIDSADVLVMTR